MEHYLQFLTLELLMSVDDPSNSSIEETDGVEPTEESANVAPIPPPTQSKKDKIPKLTVTTCEQEMGGGARPKGMSIKCTN